MGTDNIFSQKMLKFYSISPGVPDLPDQVFTPFDIPIMIGRNIGNKINRIRQGNLPVRDLIFLLYSFTRPTPSIINNKFLTTSSSPGKEYPRTASAFDTSNPDVLHRSGQVAPRRPVSIILSAFQVLSPAQTEMRTYCTPGRTRYYKCPFLLVFLSGQKERCQMNPDQ